jgi:hypothetical protein
MPSRKYDLLAGVAREEVPEDPEGVGVAAYLPLRSFLSTAKLKVLGSTAYLFGEALSR